MAKALAVAARAGALENVNINLESIQDEAFKSAVSRAPASETRPQVAALLGTALMQIPRPSTDRDREGWSYRY